MHKQGLALFGAAVAVAFSFLGCPGGGGGGGGGSDGGLDANDGVIVEPIISVSGTASVHPDAVAYLTDAGLAVPEVQGLTLKVEEPLGAATNDPNAVFGSVVLPADGTFKVDEVDTAYVILGVAAGIRDDRDAGAPVVVRSATALFDVQINEGKPETDISGAKAYALPVQFHQKLTELITPARIVALNGGQTEYDTLIKAGFILGKVVDAQGNPVAGAVLETEPLSWGQNNIFYPDQALSSVSQAGTSANGLFLFVNQVGSTPTTFIMKVKDKPEYVRRNAGASKDAALLLTVFPGRTAP